MCGASTEIQGGTEMTVYRTMLRAMGLAAAVAGLALGAGIRNADARIWFLPAYSPAGARSSN